MTANRSAEELAMRDAIETWGRGRWPSARCVHELVVGECRIDMAFIGRDHIVGVEIKSSRDTLDRMDKQMETFARHLPEVWLAVAPRWTEHSPRTNCIVVDIDAGAPLIAGDRGYFRVDRSITSAMLWLLWREELRAIGARTRLDFGKRSTVRYLVELFARRLNGDEIVTEVCRELRGRRAFWKADPPIDESLQAAPAEAAA